MEKEKALLVVCDGLGDLLVDGATPLQRARKPNLDALAEEGACGLVHAIGRGIVPGSDTSHLALFGYDPYKYYKGRGTFEALGAGVELKHGDVAFRANFATVDGKMNVVDRRAGRIETIEARKLGEELNGLKVNGVEVVFKPTTEHRATLVFKGAGLSNAIGDTDPHGGGRVLLSKALDDSKEAGKTAGALNEFTKKSFEVLNKSELNAERKKNGKQPANILLCRGAGIFEKVPSLRDLHGFESACIAGGALYKGVAKFVGMKVLKVEGATGTLETDLHAKAKAALGALKEFDFVFVHVKGCDNASHDGNLKAKIRMIEKIDEMMGELRKAKANIIVTADHSTPVKLKEHSWEPTPILFNGPKVRVDGVKKFDEISCAGGAMGLMNGLEVMPVIAGLMGRAKMFGC
ncbi:2,3-bisphosphoglycerate-independent phosphoglycerate mutase [Candidatus Micrarchaeota archaeon]|nr:2,3-bisphosphoglycerate-independent phosphoglycerate mutase [Candidatus Micrarchaeota archaeon]